MVDAYAEAVNREIEDLINKGWQDPPVNDIGMHISSRMMDSEISFPHVYYERDGNKHQVGGVWVNWRAKQIIKRMEEYKKDLLWEVGSGDGNVAIPLRKKNIAVICVEPLLKGAETTSRSGIKTYLGTLESLKLPSNSISAIGVFDVLEHIQHPNFLLNEIYRVLKPGGLLLATVPSHQWLMSDFDRSIGHFRRYSKKLLMKSLNDSGFTNLETRFMFSLFVLPAFILRKLPSVLGRNLNSQESKQASDSHNKLIDIVSPFVTTILHLESLFRLPFGLSLLSVSMKRYQIPSTHDQEHKV